MGGENHMRITIETERILIVARPHAVRGWCERCDTEVEFLTSLQAGRLLERLEQLKGQSKSELHLNRAKDGFLICLKSLLRLLQVAGGYRKS